MIKPDNFKNDPYGYVTNQIGHTVVGALFLVFFVVLASWFFMGEFPPKWSIIAGAAVGYAAFEMVTQGWRGWDTVEDWVFVVVHGTTGMVLTFSELAPGSTKFEGDLLVMLPFVALFLIHLFAGALFRR